MDNPVGTARLKNPSYIFGAASGNLYFMDNCTLRKISGGQVITIAGLAGACGYNDDAGQFARLNAAPVVADSSDNVYFMQACALRKVTPAGVVSTIVGVPNDCRDLDGSVTLARFSWQSPFLAIDPSNKIYVAGQGTLRAIATDLSVDTVRDAMGAPFRFRITGFSGLAASADSVYVSMIDQIAKVTPGVGFTIVAGMAPIPPITPRDGPGISAVIGNASQLALDDSGNLFFTDYVGNALVIRELTASGQVKTLAGRMCWSEGFSGTGVDFGSNGVGCEATFWNDIDGTDPALKSRPALAVQGGNVYIADATNSVIRQGLMTTVDFPWCLPTGDVLWRSSSTGEIRLWHMYQSFVYIEKFISGFYPPVPDPGVKVGVFLNVGGYRRCYMAQMVFRDPSTNHLAVTAWTGNFQFGPEMPDPNFTMAAIADADGDETSDVVWRNTSNGLVYIWLMNLTLSGIHYDVAVRGGELATVPDQHWQIVGTGDFDSDLKEDLFWFNDTTQEVAIWLMDGLTIKQPVLIGALSEPGWTVAGVGDFNADGKADVLWYKPATGDTVVWLMNGAQLTSAAYVTQLADLNWRARGVADYDGDGRADVFWRNVSTGENVIWFMDGVSLKSAAFTAPLSDLTWDVIGSK